MDDKQQPEWHYFVSMSGMSGVTINNPAEVAEYRAKLLWREVSEDEFDRVLNSASYDNRDMYSSYED